MQRKLSLVHIKWKHSWLQIPTELAGTDKDFQMDRLNVLISRMRQPIRWRVKNFENEPEVTDISFVEGIFIGATFLGLLNGLFLVEDYDR